MLIPDLNFFHPGSRAKKDTGSASKSLSTVFLTQKTVSELGVKLSGMSIPDPDFFPSRIPDPGVKKAPDPRS
jgi:hypothetical protein